MKAASDPERYGETWTRRFAGSFVPTVLRHAAAGADPTMRRAETLSQVPASRIPGFTQNAPILRDFWGRPVVREETGVERFLSPVRRTSVKRDPSAREIVRLAMTVGSPRRTLSGLELTSTQYSNYVERSGYYAKQKVDLLLRTRKYNAADDEEKENLIRKEFGSARVQARGELQGEDPTFPKSKGRRKRGTLRRMLRRRRR